MLQLDPKYLPEIEDYTMSEAGREGKILMHGRIHRG